MIRIDGRPRSLVEMRFAAGLVPCAACQSRDIGAVEVSGTGNHRVLHAPCPRCRTSRDLEFEIADDPMHVRTLPLHLGGPQPSRAIRPVQLVHELDRLAPQVTWDPESLAPAAWHDNAPIVERAATCLIELVKFVPEDEDAIPDAGLDAAGRADRDARPERYQRGWLGEERDRYLALVDRRAADAPRVWELEHRPPPPQGELTRDAFAAHQRWLQAGRTGPGRLDVAHVDAIGATLGAWDLTAARLHAVILDRADLAFTTLARAELREVSAVQANFADGSFAGARLVRCDLRGANLALACLDDAVIGGGRWDRVVLDCATMPRARFSGVSLRDAELGNAVLDDAVFVDCDLRGASLALRTPDRLGTSRRARWQRCDLRDTKWAERDLAEAMFVDCRFGGASGRPRRVDGIVLEGSDLSRRGDGTEVGSAAEVLARLGVKPV